MRVERIGDATLYLADCRDVLDGTSDRGGCLVIDPPYGIQFASQPTMYARKSGQVGSDWDEAAPSEDVIRMVREFKAAAVWGGNYFPLPPSRGWLVWVKPDSPPSMADAELCWTSRNANARAFHKSVKSASLEKDMNAGFHPTQKPAALMAWTIEMLGVTGPVWDFYMGSGSTGVACVALGRPFIGVERKREYFDIACRRIELACKQPRLFSVAGPSPEQFGFKL